MKRHHQGFTLIEISIVLVIVALLVSGIVVGKELIESAKLRQDVSAIGSYQTAFKTFRLKYSCVPGDCLGSQRGLGTFDGNNNGEIDNSNITNELTIDCAGVGPPTATEFGTVNKHLALAGLISQQDYDNTLYTNCVPGKMLYKLNFGRAICAYTGQFQSVHLLRLCDTGTPQASFARIIDFTPAQAYALDAKIDDGRPRTGRVHGGVYQATTAAGINYWYPGCTSNVGSNYEYQAGSTVTDTNANSLNTGCPMAFYNAW